MLQATLKTRHLILKSIVVVPSLLTLCGASIASADEFPVGQYNTIPKCDQPTCFGPNQGKTFRSYCESHGFGMDEGRGTVVMMPVRALNCFCPCTHVYVAGAAH